MRICSVKDCIKPLRAKTGEENLCPMHKERMKRNGSLNLKKNIPNSHHGKEKLPHLIVNDIISENMDKKDKEIAFILIKNGFKTATQSNVKYRRKKLGFKKYQFDGKHYSKKEARLEYGESCELCKYNLTIDVHHIIELKNGGSDELDNFCILCPSCHALIHRNKLTSMTSRKDIPKLIKELDKLNNYTQLL